MGLQFNSKSDEAVLSMLTPDLNEKDVVKRPAMYNACLSVPSTLDAVWPLDLGRCEEC